MNETDEFFDAEMTFRRYFSTHDNPNFRKRYPGRLENLDFGDSLFNDAVSAFRLEVHRRYRDNFKNFRPADGMRSLHLDYIESRETNAMAFYVDDLACIAITEPAIKAIADLAASLAVSPQVRSILGTHELGSADIRRVAGAFFTTNMQVISSHELGHIVHGHCFETARTIPRLEMSNPEEPCFSYNVENTMRVQAMEVDADGYVPHMLLQNLFGGAGKALHAYLHTTVPEPEFTMSYLLLSLGSVFYVLGPRTFDPDRVEHCDHPPALMRMNVFMRDISGWCSDNQPSLTNWGTLEKFQRIMDAVADAAGNPSAKQLWDRQGVFLRSPTGTQYIDRLYAKRAAVREEMLPHQWHVVPPSA